MSDPKPGKPIAMTFNPGPIDHPTFGKLTAKEYTIPLFVPHGSFPTPAIASDPSLLQVRMPSLCLKYGSMWPDELDDVIESKIRDSTLYQAFTNPLVDICAPEQEPWIGLGPFGFAIDDMMDQANYVGAIKYTDAVKIKCFCQDIFSGRYETLDNLPNLTTQMNHFRVYLYNFYLACKTQIPEWFTKNGLFVEELLNMMYAYVLLADADEDDDFSGHTREFFQAYCPGALGCLELQALSRGLVIPPHVASNVLFQRARVSIGAICGLTRDLLSVRRHIEVNKAHYSSVLWPTRNAGMSLQAAVDSAIQNLNQHVTDFNGAMQRLRHEYAEERVLWDYFNCAKYMLDGQVYYFQHCSAAGSESPYGDLKMKVVGLRRR